jgi:hypothetical protein
VITLLYLLDIKDGFKPALRGLQNGNICPVARACSVVQKVLACSGSVTWKEQ